MYGRWISPHGHPNVTTAIQTDMERLFELRSAIARLGEADWMRWWNSNALTDAGRYAMPRLSSRAAELSAAHVAIASARVRHDARRGRAVGRRSVPIGQLEDLIARQIAQAGSG